MKKLIQVLANERDISQKFKAFLSDAHNRTRNKDLMTGHSRVYEPVNADGLQLPPDSKLVQLNSEAILKEVKAKSVELFDIIAQKDWANQKAKANLLLDGKVLLSDVPPVYLLFLKTQLTNLVTFLEKFEELPPDKNWKLNPATGYYQSEVVKNHKTEKIEDKLVMIEPTKEHPGQARPITKDAIVGYWSVTSYCGALSKPRKVQLLERVHTLLKAVKETLAVANLEDAPEKAVGNTIFDYLFAP